MEAAGANNQDRYLHLRTAKNADAPRASQQTCLGDAGAADSVVFNGSLRQLHAKKDAYLQPLVSTAPAMRAR